jgi:DNA-binding transcriptional LysR family regulator
MRAAAEALGTNTATVSRRIDQLTKEFGVQLFRKETGGWYPTRRATVLIEIAARIEGEVEVFENSLEKPDKELRGKFSISCYQGLSLLSLVPNLESFRDRYPNLLLEIDYLPKHSLAQGDIDLAIRLELPKEGRLISKRIGTRVSGYFIKKGCNPGKEWFGLTKEFDGLPMMKQGRAFFGREPTVRLSSLSGIENAILTSDMPGPLLTCSALRQDRLRPLEPKSLVSVCPIHMVYHESRRNDPLLQTVKAWIESCFLGPQKCLCGKCSFQGDDDECI